ncbi:MAG TPA: hypothetical protein VF519_00055 [Mycobacteriales bacterium]|jgi:hypothetical protein
MKRSLALKSEKLTELTFGELRAVAGGNTPDCASKDCYTVGAACFLSLAICDVTDTCV